MDVQGLSTEELIAELSAFAAEDGEAAALVADLTAMREVEDMKHIISATALSSGAQLAMCGHVFESFDAAVQEGHKVGNYLSMRRGAALSEYHARGIDCEACIVRLQEQRG